MRRRRMMKHVKRMQASTTQPATVPPMMGPRWFLLLELLAVVGAAVGSEPLVTVTVYRWSDGCEVEGRPGLRYAVRV